MDHILIANCIICQIGSDEATPPTSGDTPMRLPLHKLEDEVFLPGEFDEVIFGNWLGQPNLLVYFYALNNVKRGLNL